MPHTFECALRWADMDMLGHVNNVRYLDFVAAARQTMFDGRPAGRAPVLEHRVDFAMPLVFHRRPVLVDSWVTAVDESRLALAHEVYDDQADGTRKTYLRAATVLDHVLDDEERGLAESLTGSELSWRELAHEQRPERDTFDVQVRPADLDERGLVSDSVLFEYLQEARIHYLMGLHTRGQSWTHHVVARKDVHYRRPMPYRSAPYPVHSWIGHVGTKSFTICAEVRDGTDVLAEASVVMVTFDQETQRPAPMSETQRERLLGELSG